MKTDTASSTAHACALQLLYSWLGFVRFIWVWACSYFQIAVETFKIAVRVSCGIQKRFISLGELLRGTLGFWRSMHVESEGGGKHSFINPNLL